MKFIMSCAPKDRTFILNFDLVNVEDCLQCCEEDNYKFIGLAHKEISPGDLFDIIRTHETEQDWTKHRTDADLRKITEALMAWNSFLIAQYDKFGIRYYETTDNREDMMDTIIKEHFGK